jgi:hypothetical protein
LHSLAANGGLSAEEAGEVRDVLEEKCRILAEGSRRRGREEEAEGYLELAREAAP